MQITESDIQRCKANPVSPWDQCVAAGGGIFIARVRNSLIPTRVFANGRFEREAVFSLKETKEAKACVAAVFPEICPKKWVKINGEWVDAALQTKYPIAERER